MHTHRTQPDQNTAQNPQNAVQLQAENAHQSPQGKKGAIQAKQRPVQRMQGYQAHQAKHQPVQRKTPPNDLKTQMGNQYGVDLSGFKEHQNSSFPGSVNALATIQGKDIHYAPGQFTEQNRKHELGHAIDNTLNGTPKGDKVVNGQSVDTTREQAADKIAETPVQRREVSPSVDSFQESRNQDTIQCIVGEYKPGTLAVTTRAMSGLDSAQKKIVQQLHDDQFNQYTIDQARQAATESEGPPHKRARTDHQSSVSSQGTSGLEPSYDQTLEDILRDVSTQNNITLYELEWRLSYNPDILPFMLPEGFSQADKNRLLEEGMNLNRHGEKVPYEGSCGTTSGVIAELHGADKEFTMKSTHGKDRIPQEQIEEFMRELTSAEAGENLRITLGCHSFTVEVKNGGKCKIIQSYLGNFGLAHSLQSTPVKMQCNSGTTDALNKEYDKKNVIAEMAKLLENANSKTAGTAFYPAFLGNNANKRGEVTRKQDKAVFAQPRGKNKEIAIKKYQRLPPSQLRIEIIKKLNSRRQRFNEVFGKEMSEFK